MLSYIRHINSQFNFTLAFCVILAIISSFTWGFDNQGYATIQAMDSYLREFGEFNHKTKKYYMPTKFLSYLNSFQYIGFAFGLIVGSIVSKRWGRKKAIFSMSFVSFLASILTITATKKEQILVGRIINYVYIGMESSCLSLFLAEIVPQTVRGFVVSTHQFSIGVGGLIIHIVSKYTSTIDSSRGWKIPIGLFFICPAIVAVGINFVPESPRWYCFNGRYDEGYDALYKYRKDKFTEQEILLEFEKIKSAVIVDQSLPKRSYKELFIKKNLRRTVTVIMIHVFQQITGQAFASQYGTIFVKSLNSLNAFTTSIISSAVAIFGVIICIVFSDIIGRKALFYIGGFIQTGALLTMGGLGTIAHPSKSVETGIVATMILFAAGFCIGVGPLTQVVATEIPPIGLRDLTYRVGMFFNIVFAFLVAFTLPYLLDEGYAHLESKVGFIYGSFSAASLLFVMFFIPECKGRSLEEINYMFDNNVPIGDFQSHKISLDDLEDYQNDSTNISIESANYKGETLKISSQSVDAD